MACEQRPEGRPALVDRRAQVAEQDHARGVGAGAHRQLAEILVLGEQHAALATRQRQHVAVAGTAAQVAHGRDVDALP